MAELSCASERAIFDIDQNRGLEPLRLGFGDFGCKRLTLGLVSLETLFSLFYLRIRKVTAFEFPA